jgi:hypothetical protein
MIALFVNSESTKIAYFLLEIAGFDAKGCVLATQSGSPLNDPGRIP